MRADQPVRAPRSLGPLRPLLDAGLAEQRHAEGIDHGDDVRQSQGMVPSAAVTSRLGVP